MVWGICVVVVMFVVGSSIRIVVIMDIVNGEDNFSVYCIYIVVVMIIVVLVRVIDC